MMRFWMLAIPVLFCQACRTEEPVSFIAKHCYDCHDADTHKGGLDLSNLKTDWKSKASLELWERIYDRVNNGEMPPKKYEQPAPESRNLFAETVRKQLHDVSFAKQQAEGRVVFRRMNRREYESSLHDMLGIATPLQPLLPEDNAVHGFDTLSKGLETSATHLLRYQDAAAKAIDTALPKAPLSNGAVRQTGKKYLESRLPVHRKGIDPFVRTDGDSLVLHARLYGDNSMQAPHPKEPGRYRIRGALRLVNTDGKPMSVLIGKRVDRFQVEKLMHIVDIVDVAAGETKIVEVETDLKYSQGNQFIYFEGMGLPWFADFEKQRGEAGKQQLNEDFKGPGLAIDWAELEGPLNEAVGYQRMFGDLPKVPRMPDGKKPPENWKAWHPNEYSAKPLVAQSQSPKTDADRLIRAFLPRAFRRPVSEELAAHYVKIVQDQLEKGEDFDEAMRAGYKAILCSTHFINYIEAPGKLDDYAVAARLARFLWSSIPDEELLATAAKGTLTQPENLKAQTERMLKDPKAARFTRSFTDQWLDLGKFLDMKPDDLYVEYDELLAWSMPLETRKFFDEVLSRDLPTSSFFHSDWTFLNTRLAKHYGIDGVEGLEFKKVALKPEFRRGGVITQGSVLKLTTNASYTSPIKRGAWLLERMIGKPPAPPPPNVKAVEPDIRGATTIREQLDKHKDVAVCASCHTHIDPPGFALENFDVVGGWRESYRVKQGGTNIKQIELSNYPGKKVWLAKAVQADGETSEGQRFKDINDYKALVLKDPDQLTRNLAAKLILYSTGAEISFSDRAVLEQIVREAKARNHGFRSLVHAVIQSPLFLNK